MIEVSQYRFTKFTWDRGVVGTDDNGRPLSYVELARDLVGYVKHMGFTHIELLPITEYPIRRIMGVSTCWDVCTDDPLWPAK